MTDHLEGRQALVDRGQRAVLDQIVAAFERGETFVSVTGLPGSGKTRLCHMLAETTDARTLASLVSDPTDLGRLLEGVLRDFGLLAASDTDRTFTEARERLTSVLRRFLASIEPLGAHALVVIDDADRVATAMLDDLFALAAQVDEGGGRLKVVFVGLPTVATMLTTANVRSPGQRIATHLTLAPPGQHEAASTTLASEGRTEPPGALASSSIVNDASTVRPAGAWTTGRPLVRLLLLLALIAGLISWWVVGSSHSPAAGPSTPTRSGPRQASDSRSRDGSQTAASAASSMSSQEAAPVTATQAAVGPQAADVADGFRITVASFRTGERADQVAAQLRERKLSATTRLDRSGTWHQVIVGPYATLAEVRPALRILMEAGFPDTQLAPAHSADAAFDR